VGVKEGLVLYRVLGLGSGSGERCERSGVVFLYYFVHILIGMLE
jgi:hypothetical protein